MEWDFIFPYKVQQQSQPEISASDYTPNVGASTLLSVPPLVLSW